jgi:hypothetical protein
MSDPISQAIDPQSVIWAVKNAIQAYEGGPADPEPTGQPPPLNLPQRPTTPPRKAYVEWRFVAYFDGFAAEGATPEQLQQAFLAALGEGDPYNPLVPYVVWLNQEQRWLWQEGESTYARGVGDFCSDRGGPGTPGQDDAPGVPAPADAAVPPGATQVRPDDDDASRPPE